MMKKVKTRSGRTVLLQTKDVPHDYGRDYQRELLNSYDMERGDRWFAVLAKVLLYCTIIFAIAHAIKLIR